MNVKKLKNTPIPLLRRRRSDQADIHSESFEFSVKEKNGHLRGVVDYRTLNHITKKNNTPLPQTDEVSGRLGEAKGSSKMDMNTVFNQMRKRKEDIENATFNTNEGQLEYIFMPIGLCNSTANFKYPCHL